MEDLGYIDSVEDAIWLGQKYPGVAIAPSLEWHSRHLLDPNREISW
jgi:hypothetical protein